MMTIPLPGGAVLGWCRLENESGHQAGRRLLSRLYLEKTGKPMPPVLLGERGKPYFEDDPLQFSISHTPKHAFCVLAPVSVGIDAEEADRSMRLELARKVLSPGEYARFEAAENKEKALLTFWVLKEASVKLTGEGLRGYPNHTNFSLEDPRVRLLDGCLVAIMMQGE